MADTILRLPPATDVIESEELLQRVSPALLTLDFNDKNIKFMWIAGSSVFFSLIFVSCIFVCNIFPSFRNLGSKIKVFLSLSVVRGLFGVFATVIGLYATFCTSNLTRDVVFGKTATSHVAMLVTVGFFIFELTTVIVSDIVFTTFSKMLIVHHSLGVYLYIAGVCLGVSFYNGCAGLVLEMSTPFSCLSYVLLKAGMENSSFWKINQMVLVHTFHLRNVMECYLWYVAYKHWTYLWHFLPLVVLIPTYFGLILVTFIMTPYWGYKKTQQLFNPVDWNFQESRTKICNGNFQNGNAKKGH